MRTVHRSDTPTPTPLRALAGRWRWLGHPAFGAAVAVLALNDHVLKDRYPGWWTGKLSDVAGLAVAGTVAAVLLGPRRGVVVAGAGFVALKAVPGVAEAASPLLGGVTLRDAGDLVALAVLPPLAWLLRTHAPSWPRPSARGRRTAAILPLVGSVGAVLTATATSCSPNPAVTAIAVDADKVYAFVETGGDTAGWAVSDDGGESWTASQPPPGDHPDPQRPSAYANPEAAGPLQACAGDGTCYRLRHRRAVERRAAGGGWTEDERLSDDEFHAISTGCPPRQLGVLTSIGVADQPGRGHIVVASLGAHGVLVRQSDGRWVQGVRVLGVENNPAATTTP